MASKGEAASKSEPMETGDAPPKKTQSSQKIQDLKAEYQSRLDNALAKVSKKMTDKSEPSKILNIPKKSLASKGLMEAFKEGTGDTTSDISPKEVVDKKKQVALDKD
eukprot:2840473-Pyramimonas_sp.AAC.2